MVQNFKISDLAMAKVEKVNIADIYKTAKLRVENLAQTTFFRFSPVNSRAPR
jgi:hypothetical protein